MGGELEVDERGYGLRGANGYNRQEIREVLLFVLCVFV